MANKNLEEKSIKALAGVVSLACLGVTTASGLAGYGVFQKVIEGDYPYNDLITSGAGVFFGTVLGAVGLAGLVGSYYFGKYTIKGKDKE